MNQRKKKKIKKKAEDTKKEKSKENTNKNITKTNAEGTLRRLRNQAGRAPSIRVRSFAGWGCHAMSASSKGLTATIIEAGAVMEDKKTCETKVRRRRQHFLRRSVTTWAPLEHCCCRMG